MSSNLKLYNLTYLNHVGNISLMQVTILFLSYSLCGFYIISLFILRNGKTLNMHVHVNIHYTQFPTKCVLNFIKLFIWLF
jgi:hypothetical protein